jgi:predicted alpha/beta superfamily hydrolase
MRSMLAVVALAAQSLHAQSVPATIPGAARWIVTNRVSGDRYELSAMLPRGADATEPRGLLLVLDGTEDFALAASVADVVRAECEIVKAPLVVAIGDGARIDMPGNRRGRDYTPTPSTVSWSRGDGGAPAFLAFLREQVLPDIGVRYRVTDERTFFGYSYGGLFGAYALTEAPSLFSRWILGSPSVFYDNNLVVRRARLLEPDTASTTRVLLTAGSKEQWAVDGNVQFAAALRSRLGARATIDTAVFSGIGHAMGKLEAMRYGFSWAGCRKPPTR